MSGRINRNRGKKVEKAIADLMGGKRVGLFGGEDVEHPIFSIEVKSRMKMAFEPWYKQAKANNRDQKVPLVVVHKKNTNYDSAYAILNIQDLLTLIDGSDGNRTRINGKASPSPNQSDTLPQNGMSSSE